jgi:hypothetical protein
MKLVFLWMALVCNTSSLAQQNFVESLDEYFAGVPLQQDFDKWVDYISKNPWLGIDSVKERGIYSSFKSGIGSYFPFSDSVKVKLLIQKLIYNDDLAKKAIDSINQISIEGIFLGDKTGKKQSLNVFKELRFLLEKSYGAQSIEYFDSPGRISFFSYGKSENFPDCNLQQGYSVEFRFYYVMISYSSPFKSKRHK